MKTFGLRPTLVASIGLLFLLVVAVVAARPTDPHKLVAITAEQAADRVNSFVPGADVVVSGPFDGLYQRYYQLTGDGVSANVDANDGTVRTLSIEANVPVTDTIKITDGQAVAAAKAFLGSHGVDDAGTPTVTLVDRGMFHEFLVEWQSRVNGALVPDYRSVSINPISSEAFVLTDFRRDYKTPPSPTVSQSTAEEAAVKLLSAEASWKIKAIDLWVVFDEAGTQGLAWRVNASDGMSQFFIVEVDAMSGQARILAQG